MKENGNVAQLALSNEAMATNLETVAELLDAHDANPYRVQAYRTAAVTLRNLDKPASKILEQQGLEGFVRLPGIGQSIAHSIEQMVHTGQLNLLQRLRGETDPERILTTVPTIGDELAHRIHEQLGRAFWCGPVASAVCPKKPPLLTKKWKPSSRRLRERELRA